MKPDLNSLVKFNVRIYWNSHRKLYSIQARNPKGWTVVGHSASVELLNARFVVSKAGHARMIRESVKNVHAYIVGQLVSVDAVKAPQFVRHFGALHATRPVSYSRTDGCFVVMREMIIWPIGESAQVWATTVDEKPDVRAIYLYDEEKNHEGE
jgi:hypothetical protein